MFFVTVVGANTYGAGLGLSGAPALGASLLTILLVSLMTITPKLIISRATVPKF